MKYKTLILFSLFSLHLYGGEYFDRGVVRVLTEANQQQFFPYSKALCLDFVGSSSADRKKETADMNDCVMALCGSPAENDTVYVTDSNFNRYISPELKKQLAQLEPRLKKLFEKEKTQKINSLSEVEEKLKKLDFSKLESSRHQQLSARMFRPYFSESIDLKKPVGQRVSVSLKNEKNLSPEFRSELQKYISVYVTHAQSNAEVILEKGLYSEPEQRELFSEKLNEMKLKFQKVFPKVDSYEKKYMAERLESFEEELKKSVGDDLTLLLINIQNLEDQIYRYDTDVSRVPDCRGTVCEALLKDYIQSSDLLTAVARAKSSLAEQDNEKDILHCKAQIVSKLSTESEKEKAVKLVEEVKQSLRLNVLPMFSSHSRKLLEDYLKNKIITSHQNVKNALRQSQPFDQLKANYDELLARDYIPFEKNDEFVVDSVLSLVDDNEENGSNINSLCLPGLDSNAFDSFLPWTQVEKLPDDYKKMLSKLPPKDHIFVSPYSCHHELRGKSIVAHELGHALNQVFASQKISQSSAKKYKSFRKCSNENYVKFIPDRVFFSHEGDSIRTEEDTADVIAFMANPSKDDLFLCGLVKPSLDNKSYDELAFILDDGDSHSTALYRLIMEAINKNRELPVSCQRALEPVKNELRLKKCVP